MKIIDIDYSQGKYNTYFKVTSDKCSPEQVAESIKMLNNSQRILELLYDVRQCINNDELVERIDRLLD